MQDMALCLCLQEVHSQEMIGGVPTLWQHVFYYDKGEEQEYPDANRAVFALDHK